MDEVIPFLRGLTPPAVPEGLRELPLFPGDRNVKRTAEPQEYNVLTLTHLYQCSGTLHKHSQTETLPPRATRLLRFGRGLCPQDLCRLPFVGLAFFLRYSLHIKAFFLGALTPAAVPVSSSLMLLHASFIACYHLAGGWLTSVFIVFKELYFLQGLQHLCHIRDGGSLLSFCQTNTQTCRRISFSDTHS